MSTLSLRWKKPNGVRRIIGSHSLRANNTPTTFILFKQIPPVFYYVHFHRSLSHRCSLYSKTYNESSKKRRSPPITQKRYLLFLFFPLPSSTFFHWNPPSSRLSKRIDRTKKMTMKHLKYSRFHFDACSAVFRFQTFRISTEWLVTHDFYEDWVLYT